MAFTTVVLLIITRNYQETLLSLISLIGIALTILATIYMSGWSLGVAESCGPTVVLGIAVDYIVHMSTAYSSSKKQLREEKISESLRRMGVSIIGGGITTFGAGLFLLPCTVSLFWKMGTLLIVAVIASLAYSLLFFSALCFFYGPEGEQGDLKALYAKILSRISKT